VVEYPQIIGEVRPGYGVRLISNKPKGRRESEAKTARTKLGVTIEKYP